MADPGGERQNPREWTLRICDDCGHIRAPVRCFHSCGVEGVRVVEASSVPVGGASRDEGDWVRVIELADEIDSMDHRFSGDGRGNKKVQEACGALRAEARKLSAPRDDQNDDEYALPDGRGVQWVCDTCGAHTTMANPESAIKWHEDNLPGHKFRCAVELGPPRAASSSAVSSSGVAPKGEQEESYKAGYDAGYAVAFEEGVLREREASPPPDRLTDEEARTLLQVAENGWTSDFEEEWPALAKAMAKLKSRLADREPEKP